MPSLPSLIWRMLCLRRRCESAAVDTSELQNAHLLVAPADSHQHTYTHMIHTCMYTLKIIERSLAFGILGVQLMALVDVSCVFVQSDGLVEI